jgi:prepilin-type N-terminal cleavage/methylation domain-containing protein/prepilin-type processing-associated H-X9-DG protein
VTLRRRGFTLIELLVVIAIIGILAAMLFPVFARARESARKIQCLSNVKNIALAIQMYLTDYDKFMPLGNMDPGAAAYFHSLPRGSSYSYPDSICNHIRQANPYAREPVILDEYIKNREVWSCPSAKLLVTATGIVPVGRAGLWYNNFIDYGYGVWHDDYMCPPCELCWPSGWGGQVTDSFKQGRADDANDGSSDSGAFVMGVSINDNMHWQNPTGINDVAKYVVCGDSGGSTLWGARFLAFPDVCIGAAPCGLPDCPEACTADWANCPDSRNCGLDTDSKVQFYKDQTFRKRFARHMGGSNVGFADGHAKWFTAETIIFQNCPWPNSVFEGLPTGCCWYPLPEPCQ